MATPTATSVAVRNVAVATDLAPCSARACYDSVSFAEPNHEDMIVLGLKPERALYIGPIGVTRTKGALRPLPGAQLLFLNRAAQS